MPTLMECGEEREADTSVELTIGQFLQSVAAARESVLLLDFDGTLAPFRIDPAKVQVWAGVRELLQEIQDAGRTRLAIVTGRPARDAAKQLALRAPVEIWGVHGAERLYPDGRFEQDKLSLVERQTLSAARDMLHAIPLQRGLRIEEKWNAVVMHWRGASAHVAQVARRRALEAMRPLAESAGIGLLQFDGGIELRAGRNKGEAAGMLLAELRSDTPVAYLGDDTTDEDAFMALSGRGLGVLVRRRWRPTNALAWLRPPGELRSFLAAWLDAVRR